MGKINIDHNLFPKIKTLKLLSPIKDFNALNSYLPITTLCIKFDYYEIMTDMKLVEFIELFKNLKTLIVRDYYQSSNTIFQVKSKFEFLKHYSNLIYPNLKTPKSSFLNSSKQEYKLFLSYYKSDTIPFINYPPLSKNYEDFLIAKHLFYLSLVRPEIKIFFTIIIIKNFI